MEKEMTLSNSEGKEYIFKLRLDEDSIHFYLKEKNVYAPFSYENSFTFNDFCEKHKAFKACDDLGEIFKHLETLHEKNRIEIMDYATKQELMIHCNISYISIEDVDKDMKEFKLELKMTKEKDRDLLELYKIEKEQLAKLKKIKKLISDERNDEYPLNKEIIRILKECQSKDNY